MTNSRLPRLERIIARLTRRIPEPARPVAKPQQSWRQLKPGQRLKSRVEFYLPKSGRHPPGTTFEVTSVNSLGVGLTLVTEEGTLSKAYLNWVRPDWPDYFERTRRVAKGGRRRNQ